MARDGYYAARKPRLLRSFDRFARRAHRHLERGWDHDFATTVLADARAEYDALIPQLPYIGGWRNLFTPVVIVNGWLVALHRAMASRGQSAEDTIRVCAAISDEFVRAIPASIRRLIGRLAFTRPVRWVFQWQASRSRARHHAEDFVYSVQVADGEFALVFDECAVNKFYDRQGLRELKPYCNFFDVTYSRLMNMGIDANETIGLGCSQCTLRYAHGRATKVPPTLTHVLPATR